MEFFLEKTIKLVLERHGEYLNEICLVIPGKRPAVYIRKIISENRKKSVWSPEILSIKEFVEQMTKLTTLDSTLMLFEMFSHINENFKKESFDEFMSWAPQAISDYNDIDNYLLEGETVFQNLKNLKDIDEWSFNNDPLTFEQENFNNFWQLLGLKYESLRKHLEERSLFYPGLLNRYMAENIKRLSADSSYKKIVFIGFNALSASENIFISHLVQCGLAEIYWDSDEYYVNDRDQEAGLFMRRHKEHFEDFHFLENDILRHPKEINLHACNSKIGEVKVAGSLLKDIMSEDRVAVLLADESFLVPYLESADFGNNKLNISMGYPFDQSAVHSLIKILLRSYKQKNKNSEKGIHHRDLKEILFHPLLANVFAKSSDNEREKLIEKINKNNGIYIDYSTLFEAFQNIPVLISCFSFLEFNEDPQSVLSFLKSVVLGVQPTLKKNALENECAIEMFSIINKLENYCHKYEFIESFHAIESLISSMMKSASLSFIGEPLEGIQITGILESRTLDFNHVFILGMNEGVLPKPDKKNSYIPYELKKYFGLPTYEEQDAIYAYYFYRLLQKSDRVDVFYSVQSEVFGSSEPSRYLGQIREELKSEHVKINEFSHVSSPVISNQSDLIIKNSTELISKVHGIFERGISPSAINVFLRCPLDFYFKYLMGLKEIEQVEENIQLNTFGSIVHDVLDKFYKPLEGKVLQERHIDDFESRIEKQTQLSFSAYFESQYFKTGYNYLSYEVAIKYVRNFLNWERQEVKKLKDENKELTIVSIEMPVSAELTIKNEDKDLNIRFKGFIDRVDSIGGKTRIIDYKTGGVSQSDLSVNIELADLAEKNSPKALQVLIYTYAYSVVSGTDWNQIHPGIISFKNQNRGFIELQSKGRSKIEHVDFMNEIQSNFPDLISAIAAGMTDPSLNWKHDDKSTYCDYCDS